MARQPISWHQVSSITYLGEQPIPIPIIPVAQNGWVYKPDELLTNSRDGNSFGRGREGVQKAHDWLKDHIERIFLAHPDVLPVSVTRQYESDRGYSHRGYSVNGLQAEYTTHLGRIQLSLLDSARHEQPTIKVTVPSVVLDIAQGVAVLDDWHGRGVNFDISGMELGRATRQNYRGVQQLIEEFYSNPYETVLSRLRKRSVRDSSEMLALLELLPPTEEPEMRVDKTFKRYLPDVRERSLARNEYQQLEKAVSLFKDLGLDISITRRTSIDGDEEIASLKITTPQMKANYDDLSPWERGGLEKHGFTITPDGVTVECGYLAHEEEWVKYQARQMEEIMAWDDGDSDEPEHETEVLDY